MFFSVSRSVSEMRLNSNKNQIYIKYIRVLFFFSLEHIRTRYELNCAGRGCVVRMCRYENHNEYKNDKKALALLELTANIPRILGLDKTPSRVMEKK